GAGGLGRLVGLGTGGGVPVTAAVAALADLEPTAAVSATDDAAWRRDVVAVRDLLRRARPHGYDPAALLSTLDSPVLGTLAGLLLQAAVRRTPAVLDGLAACAAAAAGPRGAGGGAASGPPPRPGGGGRAGAGPAPPPRGPAVALPGRPRVPPPPPPRGGAGPRWVRVRRAAAGLSTVAPAGTGD